LSPNKFLPSILPRELLPLKLPNHLAPKDGRPAGFGFREGRQHATFFLVLFLSGKKKNPLQLNLQKKKLLKEEPMIF